jgi:hypothetical protein
MAASPDRDWSFGVVRCRSPTGKTGHFRPFDKAIQIRDNRLQY